MQVTSIHNLMVSSSISYSVHRLLKTLGNILTMDSLKDQHYIVSVTFICFKLQEKALTIPSQHWQPESAFCTRNS